MRYWFWYLRDRLPVRRRSYRTLLQLLYRERVATVQPRRYHNILETIYSERCRTLLEIGTYDGTRALHMIQTANLFHPMRGIEYHGFDLFEALTPADLATEFSKTPPSCVAVHRKLAVTGAKVRLHQGYTRDTLPAFSSRKRDLPHFDFVFIDGGHSIDTIETDWHNVQHLMTTRTVVIFDDYYNNDEPEVDGLGCQSLVDSLDRSVYDVVPLAPEDQFRQEWGVLKIKMAKVTLRGNGKS